MKIHFSAVAIGILAFSLSAASTSKEKIHALYIPLADHYPGIIAHHNTLRR